MADINWGNEAQKYGPRIAKWGYQAYTQPAAAYAATAASEGSGLTGLSAGGYASVASPLLMAYLKYQAGSGRNEPLEKRAETLGSGRMLSDLAAGKKIDPNSTLENYGVRTKMLPPWMTGGEETTVDPRGYSAYDLYSRMHDIGTGRPQTGGLGNSGYSDQQIDEMMGTDKGKIATLLGVSGLPDWNKHTWGQGFQPGESTPYSTMHPQVKMDEGWAALGEEGQRPYVDIVPRSPDGITDSAQNLWEKDQQQAEIEKMLGYKLKRQMAVQRPDTENMITN
jgi:hypothetical protein